MSGEEPETKNAPSGGVPRTTKCLFYIKRSDTPMYWPTVDRPHIATPPPFFVAVAIARWFGLYRFIAKASIALPC